MKHKLLLIANFAFMFMVHLNFPNIGYANSKTDCEFIIEIEEALKSFVQLQKEIDEIHPLLKYFHPIAIVEDNHFYIFDFDTLTNEYKFIKKDTILFPMPEMVRTSFPLSGYDGKPACIVTKDIFDTKDGYVTIFHEFMHCNQMLICEHKLKEGLIIAQKA